MAAGIDVSPAVPADRVLDALACARGETRAWDALLGFEAVAEMQAPDGPLWVSLRAAGPGGSPSAGVDLVHRDGSGHLVRLASAGALLHVLGLIDDPLAMAREPTVAGTGAFDLGAALPGRWSVATAAADGAPSAALWMASDESGPYVPLGARLSAPFEAWLALLERGRWRCVVPDRSAVMHVGVSIGTLRLSREDARALDVGDLLFPDLADFEARRCCRVGTGRYRVDCVLHDQGDRSGVVEVVREADDASPAEPVPDGDGETVDLDLVVGRVRTGLGEWLSAVVGTCLPTTVALPHVWLAFRGRRLAVAELVRAETGLVLEVLRTGRTT